MTTIEISDDLTRAVLLPEMGGGLARYDYLGRGESIPLMRAATKWQSPIDLASFPMVPWSGRISNGGFSLAGVFHEVLPTFAGFDLPIHGNGWAERWTPHDVTRDSAVLELESSGPGPFRYRALLTHRLEAGALVMELAIANRADITLPYGGGFHPWFPRGHDTRLTASASGVWINDDHLLPLRRDPIADHLDWDFAKGQTLPSRGVDNCFTGWLGQARIEWPENSIGLAIEASSNLGHYVLYSPSPDCGFFCFEPVSHASNAHNLDPGPEAHGLVLLAPGETLVMSSRFTPLL
jgi:aldose 1-epimerase